MNSKKKSNPILLYILFLTPFLGGLSQHYQIFIIAIISIIILFVNRRSIVNLTIDLYVFVPIVIIIVSAIGTLLWGISVGDSLYGLMHIITCILFLLAVNTFAVKDREEAINVIPYSAALMIVITGIMYFIPGLSDIVWINSRLGGTFEYPNTFALYILIGLFIYLNGINNTKIRDYIIVFILIAGIFLTGSRSTFIMTIILSIYMIVVKKSTRKVIIPIIIGAIIIAVVYVLITSDSSSFGRFLTISFQSSTFLGRILYDIDALNMIIHRPWGYGYLGYYFVEQYFETGIYSIRFVHNDWLQMALDYGSLAFASMVWLFILLLRRADAKKRIILIIVGVHMLFDFDLQFFAIVMIVLLCVNINTDKRNNKRVVQLSDKLINNIIGNVLLISCGIVCIWLGAADFMQLHIGREDSLKIYPWTADVKLHAMADTSDNELQYEYANELVDSVEYIGPSYDVLANYAIDNNDPLTAIDMKKKSITYQKYNIIKYNEYSMMLCDIIEKHRGINDDISNSALESLNEIPGIINEVIDNTNPIAYMINDKPNMVLSDDVITRINSINAIYNDK